MTAIPFGAIVLTDFPFTDLTTTKRRPALVISTNNDRRTDVVVAYITSILREDQDAIAIAPTAGTGLKVPSLVRFDKIATINKDLKADDETIQAMPSIGLNSRLDPTISMIDRNTRAV